MMRKLAAGNSQVMALAAVMLCPVPCAVMAAGPGGVKLDGTLGSSATLSGPTYNIIQSLGKVSGNNLFFSFQYFNVGTGETALFSTTTPSLANVISRITGGTPSLIDGTIRLSATAAAPNFFLINPSGVTFTANAAVDVPAAFHVTTASYVKFPDGNFYADPARASTLSAAEPEAFGFLGQSRATVAIDGAALAAGDGTGAFDVVAGDVSLIGNGNNPPVAGIETGTGGIRVAAVGQQAIEAPISGVFNSYDGTVSMQSGAELGAGTPSANERTGGIVVVAGALTADGSGSPVTTGLLSVAGGLGADPIDVRIGGSVLFEDGGGISSLNQPQYSQPAAEIDLLASSLTIQGNNTDVPTGIASRAFGAGAGGKVEVGVATLKIDGANPDGKGFVGIGSTENAPAGTTVNGTSKGGDVAVVVTGATSIVDGGELFASTQSAANAGSVGLLTGALTIDGTGSAIPTGLASIALANSSGQAAVVLVDSGSIAMTNGATINSDTFGSGGAGGVVIKTGSLAIDGGPTALSTGVSSVARPGSTGAAGLVGVQASGAVTLARGASISSDTYGPGGAGGIEVQASSVTIDAMKSGAVTGISSSVETGATGSGGEVFVTAGGAINVLNGGDIQSISDGAGNAGSVTITAGSLAIDGGGVSSSTAPHSTGAAGHLVIQSAGTISITDGGQVGSDTYGPGNAGEIDILADSLSVEGSNSGISSSAAAGTTGNAGLVVISASGAVGVTDGGFIQSLTLGSGNAGGVGIATPGAVSVANGGLIQSDTFATGAAGVVKVIAGSVMVDGATSPTVTGISSVAGPGSAGSAGIVEIDSQGALSIVRGGEVRSDTFGAGNAGAVNVTSGSVSIDGMDATVVTGISSSTERGTTGKAGQVAVLATGALSLQDGGLIQSISLGSGNAGAVAVAADSVTMAKPNAQVFTGLSSNAAGTATANAGGVAVVANTLSIDSGGVPHAVGISSNSEGAGGNAGLVAINVNKTITLTNNASIASVTRTSGYGGDILIQADSINGSGESEILSDTTATGAAGAVSLTVRNLNLNKSAVSSSAETGSGGQPGQITVTADNINLNNQSAITIENNGIAANPAAIRPTLLAISASGNMRLQDGSTISASSTGNVGGSSIDINYGRGLLLDPSYIQTIAFSGSGGSIDIVGHGPLILDHSTINTSEFGTTAGNGGNINVTAPYLILNSGVIAANTSVPLASGGDVTIDSLALIPSSKSYQLGGNPVLFDPNVAGLNVVQAAAPAGFIGNLAVTVPTLDLGNSLVSLPGAPAVPPPLGRSACRFTQGSSLAVTGRGGLPPSGFDPLWFDPQDLDATSSRNDAHMPDAGEARLAALVTPVCR